MVREDILGGLKLALQKGESLKQAMMSFHSAGYTKEEIDEAARVLEAERAGQPAQPVQPQQPQPIAQPVAQVQPPQPTPPAKTVQNVSAYGQPAQPVQPQPVQQPQPVAPQTVSAYGQAPKNPKGKAVVFILVALLFVLLGILAAVFFFKEELTEFLNNAFQTYLFYT